MARPGYCEIVNEHGVHIPGFHCPHGQPGDRLWVKETFFAWGRWETRYSAKKARDEWHFVDMTLESGKVHQFEAPHGYEKSKLKQAGAIPTWHKRPSIFMPRVASRILLEITSVSVERLQSISEADAKAEGVEPLKGGFWKNYVPGWTEFSVSAKGSFCTLWQSINGADSWAANPWVWVIEFQRVQT